MISQFEVFDNLFIKNVFISLLIKYSMKKIVLFLILAVCLPLCLVGCEKDAKLSSYRIDVKFNDEEKTLECFQEINYVNTSDNALFEVDFYLYANSFTEGQKAVSNANFEKAYPNGESFGKIEFESVKVGGKEAITKFEEPDKNILSVSLEKELFPNEEISISMEYVVSLANINHRLGYGDKTVNCGSFFPIACVYENGFVKNGYSVCGDPFYSDVANFEVNITYPTEYVLASSGNQKKIEDGVVSCQGKNIRDFCFVLSKEFEVLTKDVKGVKVNYFYYEDENANQFLETSCKAVEDFQKMFGKYPYQQLSVVKTNFCFGGMEYPNLVMIADDITDIPSYNYVIVHEIAHQWWYGVVGNNEYTDAWVDEGLTEYSTALFFENNKEYGFEYDKVIDNAFAVYKNFVQVYSSILGDVDESMQRDLSQFETEPEYVNCTYTKGMLLFDSLRETLGKRKFEKCLKNYYKEYKFKNSSYEKMVESFCRNGNRNVESLFKSFVEGTVVIG